MWCSRGRGRGRGRGSGTSEKVRPPHTHLKRTLPHAGPALISSLHVFDQLLHCISLSAHSIQKFAVCRMQGWVELRQRPLMSHRLEIRIAISTPVRNVGRRAHRILNILETACRLQRGACTRQTSAALRRIRREPPPLRLLPFCNARRWLTGSRTEKYPRLQEHLQKLTFCAMYLQLLAAVGYVYKGLVSLRGWLYGRSQGAGVWEVTAVRGNLHYPLMIHDVCMYALVRPLHRCRCDDDAS